MWWVLVFDKFEFSEGKVIDGVLVNVKRRKYVIYEMFEVFLELRDIVRK